LHQQTQQYMQDGASTDTAGLTEHYFNIILTMHSAETNFQNQTFMHWNIYITHERNSLLLVLALLGCYLQGFFTVVQEMLSKWSVVCSTFTHWHT